MPINRIQIVSLVLLILTFYMNFYKLEYIRFLQEQLSENKIVPYKIYPWQYVGTPSLSTPEWLSKHLVSSLVHVVIVIFWNIQNRININYGVFISHINFWLVISPSITRLGSLHWLVALMINLSVFVITSVLLFFHYINNNKLKYMLVLTFPVIFETVLWLMNER